MARTALIVIALGLLSGCAASNKPAVQASLSECRYAPVTAPALAFDVPTSGAKALPDMQRDDREAAAFGGFQGLASESYDIEVDDDQQFYTYPSTYERRVQSDRVGIIYH